MPHKDFRVNWTSLLFWIFQYMEDRCVYIFRCLISFICHKSYSCFVRITPKCFLFLFWIARNSIVFLISVSTCSLLYVNIQLIFVYLSWFCSLANAFILKVLFLGELYSYIPWVYTYINCHIILTWKRKKTVFFLVCMSLISCLWHIAALARTFCYYVEWTTCSPNFPGKTFCFSPLSVLGLVCDFSVTCWRGSLYSCFSRVLTWLGVLIFLMLFLCWIM